jgi:hypothetical protein
MQEVCAVSGNLGGFLCCSKNLGTQILRIFSGWMLKKFGQFGILYCTINWGRLERFELFYKISAQKSHATWKKKRFKLAKK